MAPLPEARLGTSLRCFAHSGVDLNVKPESRITPRSLADETGRSCCPRKGTVTSVNFETSCRVPKSRSLVLSGFISK